MKDSPQEKEKKKESLTLTELERWILLDFGKRISKAEMIMFAVCYRML